MRTLHKNSMFFQFLNQRMETRKLQYNSQSLYLNMLIQRPESKLELPTTGPNTYAQQSKFNSFHSSRTVTIGLIQCIVEENNMLTHQIRHTETQMGKARGLSQGLLRENESLRQLYQGRTRDIGRLVGSISVNTDEDAVDYQHQCFLLQELNCATLKQIKVYDRERSEIRANVDEKVRSIQELSERKTTLEQEGLNKLRVRINNGLSTESIRQQQAQYETELKQLMKLQSQVSQLLVQNCQLKNDMKEMKNHQEFDRHALASEKVELVERIKSIQKENQNYKDELSKDKLGHENSIQEKTIKEEKYKQATQAMYEQIRKFERMQKQSSETNGQRQKIKDIIAVSVRKQEKYKEDLQGLQDKKIELREKILTQKRKLVEGREQMKRREVEASQIQRQKINQIMITMRKNESNADEEYKKLTNERQIVNNSLQSLETQYQSLEQQVESYEKTLQQYTNPLPQIERIELKLRLKKIR